MVKRSNKPQQPPQLDAGHRYFPLLLLILLLAECSSTVRGSRAPFSFLPLTRDPSPRPTNPPSLWFRLAPRHPTAASTSYKPMVLAFSGEDYRDFDVLVKRPLIITGPSGVGKGTLINRLLKQFPDRFGFSVSHTTRGPRPGEVAGKDYHYVSKDELLLDIEAGLFLEHAVVHGNLYGTSFEAIRSVQARGKICILDVDVQGVKNIRAAIEERRASDLDPVFMFIAPPSLEELERRLRGRMTENEKDVVRRLGNANGEVQYGWHPGNFDKVVVNHEVDDAYQEIRAYIAQVYGDQRFLDEPPELIV